MWKRLSHPNIVPLIGVTFAPFQFVSVWYSGGDLLEFVHAHPHVNRLPLVGCSPTTPNFVLTPPPSYLVLQTASTTYIPTMLSTVISKEFVKPRRVFEMY